MKIAIYGQLVSRENVEYIEELFDWLLRHNVKVVIYAPYKNYLAKTFRIDPGLPEYHCADDLSRDVDCMISIGGDGTMLNTIQLIRDSGIPVVGLNIGRLGFLSSISKDQIESALLSIIDRKFSIDTRSLIQATASGYAFGEDNFALNEVTLLKKDSSSMIRINTWLDGEFFCSYWADGLIISTPTGSTGYSLSCGGPIVMPASRSFVITPIAPHNLNMRPVVIQDTTEIRLTVESRNKSFLCTLDSHSHTLKKDEEIILKKCDFSINLVKMPAISHISTLHNKLLWGIDKRN